MEIKFTQLNKFAERMATYTKPMVRYEFELNKQIMRGILSDLCKEVGLVINYKE